MEAKRFSSDRKELQLLTLEHKLDVLVLKRSAAANWHLNNDIDCTQLMFWTQEAILPT